MAAHTPRSILVIDDEPGIVHALTRLLQRDGYVVETAGNGRYGLAALQMKRYDVILCDLHMPDVDGPAFYAILVRQYPALRQRVIFLTGDTRGSANTTFLTQSGRTWLRKACQMACSTQVIEHVLKGMLSRSDMQV